MHKVRWGWLAAAAVAAAVLAGTIAIVSGSGDGGNSPATAQPNLVVVMTDDQTVAGMQALPRTRRVIGDAGVSFDDFHVTDPLCCPSRATLLTGQYAHNHGVHSNGGPLAYPALQERQTLAVWLERAGYRTVHVGKYLNGYGLERPQRVPPGWSEWRALLDPSTERYYDYLVNENGTVRRYGSSAADYKTRVLGGQAVAAIRGAASSERPLFLFVGFNAPHAPSTPAARDEGAFASSPRPSSPAFDEADVSDKPSFIRDLPPLSTDALARIDSRRRRSLESLLAVDREVARIVAELRRQGELERTYVLFTSDNGYLAGEHRIEFGKLLPYEPSTRVPLLVRGPGVPAGETVAALAGNVDLAPTLLELASAEPDLALDGRSLVPFLEEPALTSERPLLIESLVRDRSTFYGYPYRAIRTERHLYVEYSTGDLELYDLARDPFELESRADAPDYTDTRRDLAQERWRDYATARARTAGSGCPNPGAEGYSEPSSSDSSSPSEPTTLKPRSSCTSTWLPSSRVTSTS